MNVLIGFYDSVYLSFIMYFLQNRFPPQAVQAASERARGDRQHGNWNRDRERDRPVREDLRRDFLRDDERRVDRDKRDRDYNRSRESNRRPRESSPRDRRDRSPQRSHHRSREDNRHREFESRYRSHRYQHTPFGVNTIFSISCKIIFCTIVSVSTLCLDQLFRLIF